MCEIKILNFKQYDEQPKHARPYTEHKTKEFKDLKFQFKVRTLKKRSFNEVIFVDPWLDLYKDVIADRTIDQPFNKQLNILSTRIEKLT